MRRVVVNVATGSYVRGQERLRQAVESQADFLSWADVMPPGSPSHTDVPYAFKAWAILRALDAGHETILWADSSMLPISPLGPLFERIEAEGYWISRNGWMNHQWTADDAYSLLYPGISTEQAREQNRQVEHVVATAFGLSANGLGRKIFDQYLMHARDGSFRGPWKNGPVAARQAPCGPTECLGHRHDQTALSVIAWRSGCVLTNPPQVFAYRGGETAETILVADGSY